MIDVSHEPQRIYILKLCHDRLGSGTEFPDGAVSNVVWTSFSVTQVAERVRMCLSSLNRSCLIDQLKIFAFIYDLKMKDSPSWVGLDIPRLQ